MPSGRCRASETSRARIRARTRSPIGASMCGTTSSPPSNASVVSWSRDVVRRRHACRGSILPRSGPSPASGRCGPSRRRRRRSARHFPSDSTTTVSARRVISVTEWLTYTIGMREFVAQALDVVEDLRLARHVERSQRLVHEQDARLGKQGAADGDTLLLAARQRPGLSPQQRTQAQQIDHAHVVDECGSCAARSRCP